jgi:hypothetical protein
MKTRMCFAVLASGLTLAASAQASPVDDVAAALSPTDAVVYVAPQVKALYTDGQIRKIERLISDRDPGRVQVAVVPANWVLDISADAAEFTDQLDERIGLRQGILIVLGARLTHLANGKLHVAHTTLDASTSFTDRDKVRPVLEAAFRAPGDFETLTVDVVRRMIALDPEREGAKQHKQPRDRIISTTTRTETHTTTIPGWLIGALLVAVIVAISLAIRLRQRRQDAS